MATASTTIRIASPSSISLNLRDFLASAVLSVSLEQFQPQEVRSQLESHLEWGSVDLIIGPTELFKA